MFTGIVQTQGTVTQIQEGESFRQITVTVAPRHLEQVALGASIAINGCCLTVVAFDETRVIFDIIDETLRLTNLGELKEGDLVNFERSLKVGDEIGGHYVSGHVHCTGQVVERIESTDNLALWIEFPEQYQAYVLAKGFISVNGASLTIGQVIGNRFSLHLIPETLRLTNLEQAQRVNLEFDQQTITIVETVERVLAARQ
ncbi:riboflavin synthase alpha chain [Pseudidiomarina indica]|uniref:Riboflavin synthase n=1 Tax=Pseudidiomarina indica TaxID=1159017 RepID=A0A1G6A011_9GAMM|nr:riboflavin synthase subunit alpha [Pseudidiomarina indica]SDB01788.1 riboflavin synthase alpha chain [Pseudidiomarina indica]